MWLHASDNGRMRRAAAKAESQHVFLCVLILLMAVRRIDGNYWRDRAMQCRAMDVIRFIGNDRAPNHSGSSCLHPCLSFMIVHASWWIHLCQSDFMQAHCLAIAWRGASSFCYLVNMC